MFTLLENLDPEHVTRRHGRDKALALWARRDPAAAVAWFEEQLAGGEFRKKWAPRGKPEGLPEGFLLALVSSDPAAAERITARFPEGKRIDLFGGGIALVNVNELTEQIRVLRGQLPDKDRLSVIAWPLTESTWHGETGLLARSEVEAYFKMMDATPEERRASLLAMASMGRYPRSGGKIFQTTTADIDRLREWVAEEDPAMVTEVTAEALQSAIGHTPNEFLRWAEYTEQLHQNGEHDAILVAVLKSHSAPQHPEAATALAERLPPGEERERFLEQFAPTVP